MLKGAACELTCEMKPATLDIGFLAKLRACRATIRANPTHGRRARNRCSSSPVQGSDPPCSLGARKAEVLPTTGAPRHDPKAEKGANVKVQQKGSPQRGLPNEGPSKDLQAPVSSILVFPRPAEPALRTLESIVSCFVCPGSSPLVCLRYSRPAGQGTTRFGAMF